MEFIGVRDFRNNSASIWKKLQKEKEMVITSNGKPVAVLSSINGVDFEAALKVLRQARAMTATRSMHHQSVNQERDSLSLNDINMEIAQVRKRRVLRQ